MRVDHLNGLRAAEAVLRLGSFRAAAEEIGITTAALGQRIRTVEDAWSCQLFRRTPTGPEPTPVARQIEAKLASGLQALASVQMMLSGAQRGNRLWLTMTQAMAEHWLPPLLPKFLTGEGEVDLRVDTSHMLVDLTSGEFDFGIRFSDDPPDGLGRLRLMPGSIAPVCTADFAHRYSLTPDTRDISGIPLCNVTAPNSDPDWVSDWQGWCALTGVVRTPGTESDPHFSHYGAGLRLATAGLSMMLCGMLTSFEPLRAGRLVLPFGPDSVVWTRYSSWLVWSGDRRLTPLQKRFRDWLAAEADRFNRDLDDWLAGQAR